jgi:hypothetical protein
MNLCTRLIRQTLSCEFSGPTPLTGAPGAAMMLTGNLPGTSSRNQATLTRRQDTRPFASADAFKMSYEILMEPQLVEKGRGSRKSLSHPFFSLTCD